jgi:FAD/FMN-containing dehydrogenase
MTTLCRRAFVRSLAASAVVLGFDWTARSWVTSAQPYPAPFDALPRLEGRLLLDEDTRSAFASDFGRILYRTPVAVLKPGSVQDVVEMVRFANRHALPIAMRGSDHSMFGQSQVDAGIVIDSSSLDSIRIMETEPTPAVEVGCGARWGAVLDAANEFKLTPPVNVDWMTLTVGGTLATGGIGGTTWRDGFQTDHVLELQVVTGDGQLVTCSDRRNNDLFHAVLCGMGHVGGTRMTWATIPFSPDDWVAHYGEVWPTFRDAKRRFDPNNVLTPGPGIFPRL